MNYFAHACRFLDRPLYMAGLAVPDWLSVVNRRCRVRRADIHARLDSLSPQHRELALGIAQHLDDDQWFHGTAAFFDLTGDIARRYRALSPPDEEWRCGFLGHLTLELLIDGVLIADRAADLARYYSSLEELDPAEIERMVAELSTRPPSQLAEFIPLFLRERFLEDYVDDVRLLRRINQVCRRVGLAPLGAETVEVLQSSRPLVRSRLRDLLPFLDQI